jgi:uncharacterized membrane protein YkvI
MRQLGKILQVAFTFIGTVVGAGFATGREILQFFTQYGWTAVFAIVISALLFVWLGTKMMILAGKIGAVSYEDLNVYLFGPQYGRWVSHFMLVVLLGVNTVMLAGAGSVFEEHLNLSYEYGLLLTMLFSFLVIRRGISAILTVNTIVVPVTLMVTGLLVLHTLRSPAAGHWIHVLNEHSPFQLWTSPFLYAAFNLSLAQAVLVPVGAEIKDRRLLQWGGWIGGAGIGFMLIAGHYVLTTYMPGIRQYEIPMASIAMQLGVVMKFVFILLIFTEVFTSFVADSYGLVLQLQQRLRLPQSVVAISVLSFCYIVSHAGFSFLLGLLYPLFGMVSLIWLMRIAHRRPG